MWIRSVARARLIERLLVIAVVVSIVPPGLLTAAPQEGDAASIWACEQQEGTLRLVADRADCAKNEPAVNLNNTENPVSVCVRKDDQVIHLARAAKGGSRHDDCKSQTETISSVQVKLPGSAATPLCVPPEGLLADCAEGSEPIAAVPPRNQPAETVNDVGESPRAGADPAQKEPKKAAQKEPKKRASKPDRKPARNHSGDASENEGNAPGAGTDPADEQAQEPGEEQPEEQPKEPVSEPDRTSTRANGSVVVDAFTAQILACTQQSPGLLRAVARKGDCRRSETPANLNNRKRPAGSIVDGRAPRPAAAATVATSPTSIRIRL